MKQICRGCGKEQENDYGLSIFFCFDCLGKGIPMRLQYIYEDFVKKESRNYEVRI
jgi:hypothetical protein